MVARQGGDTVRAIRNLVRAGKLQILTTDLTTMEIAKHFAAHDQKSLGQSLRPHVRQLIYELTDVQLPEMESTDVRERLWDCNKNATEAMLHELDAKVLSVDTVVPSSVFSDYAEGKGIFDGSSKKDQFPDAFLIK